MTIVSIVAALVVGCALGGAAAVATHDRRQMPAWVLISVGVAAALAGAMLARLAGLDSSDLRLGELFAQVVAAGLAVGGAAAPSWRGVRGDRGAQARSMDRAEHAGLDEADGRR